MHLVSPIAFAGSKLKPCSGWIQMRGFSFLGITSRYLRKSKNLEVIMPWELVVDSNCDPRETSILVVHAAMLPTGEVLLLGGSESETYFGCVLDFNQAEPRLPLYPESDGPFDGELKSLQELTRGFHQCLDTEIHFGEDLIPARATPSTSDKLAQCNIWIEEAPNPGVSAESRTAMATCELQKTRAQLTSSAGRFRRSDAPRKAIGSFQIDIPVRLSEEVLPGLIRRLSVLKHIVLSIPEDDRCYPIMVRLLEGLRERMRGLGVDPDNVESSPDGAGKTDVVDHLMIQMIKTTLGVIREKSANSPITVSETSKAWSSAIAQNLDPHRAFW